MAQFWFIWSDKLGLPEYPPVYIKLAVTKLIMPNLTTQLQLTRCPHCSVATPSLVTQWNGETRDQAGQNLRRWRVYACTGCGGLVTASAPHYEQTVTEHFPSAPTVPTDLPARASTYLEQAVSSIHAPAGAVMLTASAVDAMLKAKGYTEGSHYARIDKSAANHLITEEMAQWAHAVRLDANDQRHADEAAALPTEVDARRCIDFASSLGLFLFTLPARVSKGLAPLI